MSGSRQVYYTAQGDTSDKPFVVIGILGLLGACGVGAYVYKHKGNMSPSMYLMQMRVAAQGVVVSALTVGLAYSIVTEHLLKDGKKND